MYYCTNCGAQVQELFRRYCPSVLKLLKCEHCGLLADKYIEYDPAIVFVDLILNEKQAYRHILYNSNIKSYGKLSIVLWLVESLRGFFICEKDSKDTIEIENILDSNLQGNCNFYLILLRTFLSILTFFLVVVLATEIIWFILQRKPQEYSTKNLLKALIIGASGQLLGLLGIIWRQISTGPHYILIQGYTILSLLTAYSVVCRSGKLVSLIVLGIGFVAHYYISAILSTITLENLQL